MKAWPISHGTIGRRLGDDFAAVFQEKSAPRPADASVPGAGQTLWVVDSCGAVVAVPMGVASRPDRPCASRGLEDC